MRAFARAAKMVVGFVVVSIGLAVFAAFALALGSGFAIYLGAILAAWLFGAFFLPMIVGVISPTEILDGIRAQRRHETHFEGERLPPKGQDIRLGIRNTPRKRG